MQYTLTRSADPASEPITLAEAKAQAWIETGDSDTLINEFIKAGREHCEDVSGLALFTQTWLMKLDDWPAGAVIIVPRPPLQSVSAIVYIDTAGVSQTWDSSNYDVDTDSKPGRITLAYGKSWPSVRPQANAITITFIAGWSTVAAIPQRIKESIRTYVHHRYENRGNADGANPETGEIFYDRLFSRFAHGYVF